MQHGKRESSRVYSGMDRAWKGIGIKIKGCGKI